MGRGEALSALGRGEEAEAARARSEALKEAPSNPGSEHEIAELHLLFPLNNISRRRVAYDFSQEQPRP